VEPSITKDQIFFFYRAHSKDAKPSTDDGLPPVQNQDALDDNIYVTVFLTAPGTVVIESGSINKTFGISNGINTVYCPWQEGQQTVYLIRNGNTVLQKTGVMKIDNQIKTANFDVYADST